MVMTTVEKKQALLQTLALINDESIIDELYEVLHPQEGIIGIDREQLPQELQS